MMSLALPAPSGTIAVMVLVGQSCAEASCGKAIANDASNRARLRWIMAFPSDLR